MDENLHAVTTDVEAYTINEDTLEEQLRQINTQGRQTGYMPDRIIFDEPVIGTINTQPGQDRRPTQIPVDVRPWTTPAGTPTAFDDVRFEPYPPAPYPPLETYAPLQMEGITIMLVSHYQRHINSEEVKLPVELIQGCEGASNTMLQIIDEAFRKLLDRSGIYGRQG